MIGDNIAQLRKQMEMTQEELAEKLGVSRQAVAKWEKGETIPDMFNCIALSELFQVSIDDLIRYDHNKTGLPLAPQGKYFFGSLKIDELNRITIPDRALKVFDMKAGDKLLMFGDVERGIALTPHVSVEDFIKKITSGKKK